MHPWSITTGAWSNHWKRICRWSDMDYDTFNGVNLLFSYASNMNWGYTVNIHMLHNIIEVTL